MVARASLVHQINAAAAATTTTIAAAANRSALVRRSGLTIGRQRRRLSWRAAASRPPTCGGDGGDAVRACRRRTRRPRLGSTAIRVGVAVGVGMAGRRLGRRGCGVAGGCCCAAARARRRCAPAEPDAARLTGDFFGAPMEPLDVGRNVQLDVDVRRVGVGLGRVRAAQARAPCRSSSSGPARPSPPA